MGCPLYHYNVSIFVSCTFFCHEINFVCYKYNCIFFTMDTVRLEHHLSPINIELMFAFVAEKGLLKAACSWVLFLLLLFCFVFKSILLLCVF